MHNPFLGFIAAPYTPFDAVGRLRLSVIPAYAAQLKADGVAGVFVGGTTGEGVSLSLRERMDLAEAWQATDMRLWVHVGSESLTDAKALSAHAQTIGAAAIGAMGPAFWKVSEAEILADYCAEIAAAAPALDFYYYHIPSMTGLALSMPRFLSLAAERIPTLRGLKFTHSDFYEMQQCLRLADERFVVLNGFDEMLLAGLACGASGAIGSTYNYMTPAYLALLAAWQQGDLTTARHWQRLSVDLVEVLSRFRGSTIGGKGVLTLCGIDCGPNRLPLQSLRPAELQALEKALHEIDFFVRLDQARNK